MDNNSLPIVVRNVKRIMKERSMPAYKLADFAGLPRAHVYNLLAQRSWRKNSPPHSPTLRTLDRLADALGVETHELMTPVKTEPRA